MSKYDVFTPLSISTQMQSYLPTKGTLLEPSVGEGALISGLSGQMDVYDISEEYLSKIPTSKNIHKHCADFLKTPISKKYTRIISNPPFQKYQEIPEENRELIRKIHPCLETGNVDIYVAFLLKCIECLHPKGTFVAVCPSTWMFNVSCKGFREFLYSNRYIRHIHDFGSTKIFPDVDVYCTIVVFDKKSKSSFTYNDQTLKYGLRLAPHSMIQIETEKKQTLGDVATIQNGIATLSDKTFIHTKKLYDEPCWKPIFKVSKQKDMWAIVPYLPEDKFKEDNPFTYEFLTTKREELEKRDKGKKTYPAWYFFGRQQSLTLPSQPESVYISTLCNPDISKSMVIRPTQLFYSGLRVTPKFDTSCEKIVELLCKTDLTNMCSKRSNDWLNVTATVLKSIPF